MYSSRAFIWVVTPLGFVRNFRTWTSLFGVWRQLAFASQLWNSVLQGLILFVLRIRLKRTRLSLKTALNLCHKKNKTEWTFAVSRLCHGFHGLVASISNLLRGMEITNSLRLLQRKVVGKNRKRLLLKFPGGKLPIRLSLRRILAPSTWNVTSAFSLSSARAVVELNSSD